MTDIDHWSEAAAQWIAWTRSKNHDAFWAYEEAFQAFVGNGSGNGVELGAGEGRISRSLGSLGWRMTLVEPVEALITAAEAANSGDTYIRAAAHEVPLAESEYELVVLYNMLMDVDDLQGTTAEAARLCAPHGRVVVGLVHPILDVLHGRESGPLEPPYFVSHEVDDTCTRNGLEMRFRGWRRPLSAYINALAATGLAIVGMAEPAPQASHPVTSRLTNGKEVPLFLWMEARLASVASPGLRA